MKKAPYLFLLPYLTIFAAFWAGPIVYSIYLSIVNTRAYPWTVQPAVNWGRMAHDPIFYRALGNTLLLLGVQVPLMLGLAVAMAVALNSRRLRARVFFRFAFFAPVVVGAVAYSAIFRLLFNTRFGAVNAICGRSIDWLYNPWAAMLVLVAALTWRWTGYNAIILLSGLQAIPAELYEAAQVDGAGPWRQFFAITLPSLRNVLIFCAVLSVIGTLQLFTEPLLITNGGPNNATLTLGLYLYRQGFRSFNFGYASAIAYSMALLALLFAALQARWLRSI